MNIIQMQDKLKDLSDNQLRTYVENPRNMQGSGVGQGGTSHGYVPTYLILGEMKRRKDSRSKYQGEKAQQKTTVADDLVTEQGIGNQMTRNPMSQPTAGVGTPQPQEPINPAMLASKGIGQLNPGAVKQMNDGGIVGYEAGDLVRKTQARSQQTDYSKPVTYTDYLDLTMATESGVDTEKLEYQSLLNEIKKQQGPLDNNFPSLLGSSPEDIAKNQLVDDFKIDMEKATEDSGGGYMPNEQDNIDSVIAFQTSINEEEAKEKDKLQQTNNIQALIDAENFKNNKALLDSAGKGSETVTEVETDFEGAKLDTGILDTSIYEETNPILEGDEAVEAYERRVGVSPFVALAGKYEQEIGENIAENKKQSIGKFLFNFGSELANSGQVGKALKVGGKDFEKDMDRLTALKREQRKVNFDIAKITDMERMTKGKLGADVEAREKLMNNKRKLQKNADILKRDENEYKKKYYDRIGVKALEEAKVLKQYESAKISAVQASYKLAKENTFGSEDRFEKWTNRENQIEAYAMDKGISYKEAAAEVLKNIPGEATKHLNLKTKYIREQNEILRGLSPEAVSGAPNNMPAGLNPITKLFTNLTSEPMGK